MTRELLHAWRALRTQWRTSALAAGLALARVFSSQLYGLSYVEPATYLVVALGLTVVALLASLRPALAASRSDPSLVLRED